MLSQLFPSDIAKLDSSRKTTLLHWDVKGAQPRNYNFLPTDYHDHVKNCKLCRSVSGLYWQEARKMIGHFKAFRFSDWSLYHKHFEFIHGYVACMKVHDHEIYYNAAMTPVGSPRSTSTEGYLVLPLAPDLPFKKGYEDVEFDKLKVRIAKLQTRKVCIDGIRNGDYQDGRIRQYNREIKALRIDMRHFECQSGLPKGLKRTFDRMAWAEMADLTVKVEDQLTGLPAAKKRCMKSRSAQG